ncbi:MAG TPA: hypothetical protein VLF68_04265 [Candidatus Saccharimonadales bacterium]|nr:hypothetical protein [Candidatus Saccharimonadales bacterium]
MKKIFLFLLVCIGYLCSNNIQAHAQGVSLAISPATVRIQASPQAQVLSPLTIENKGDQSVTLRIIFKPFKAEDELGHITFLNPDDRYDRFFQNVQVIDLAPTQTVTLAPLEKKKLTLSIATPSDISEDYYFSVLFVSNSSSPTQNDTKNSVSAVAGGIATNVIFSPQVDVASNLSIDEFTTSPLKQSGPVPFTLRIANQGDHATTIKGSVSLTNMFGQTIGKVDLPSTNILAKSTRRIINDYSKQTLLWNEKLIFGFYTAKLTLTSPNGATVKKTIHFAAFPTEAIIGAILILLGILFIARRVKKHM